MADTRKVLFQTLPSAGTLTDAYTVATATAVTGSTIVVCNESSTAAKYRISVAVAGAADELKQYIAYDVVLPGNTSSPWTIGYTLAASAVIRVFSNTGMVAFNGFGLETT